AHSYIMSFDHEIDAFRNFVKTFPENSTLLIDTYNDLKGAENAVVVAKQMEKEGFRLNAVRLDSGNLLEISKSVRRILDMHGLTYVKIFASGDLDEYVIEDLLEEGAKIDAFGVGTRMSTSFDRPYVDVVYKLSGKVERGVFVPAMKLSKGKITLPGKKQIFRQYNKEGKCVKDTIGLENEKIKGEPLLRDVMRKGHIACDFPALLEIRKIAHDNLSQLPDEYKKLSNASTYPVILSSALKRIKNQLAAQLERQSYSA
ncbi:nicotinate phosphoribosyltransferase, partial [Candidatus Bathyarchaeota archaeon]|nr:nicotinate phosphoribosyltransferase [Candidatus Bathyarchaeota archaeon]